MSESLEILNHMVIEQAKEIRDLQADLVSMKKKQAQRDTERMIEERQRLRAGIKALGAIILVLGGVLWAYRAVIIGDAPRPPHN